MDFLSLLSASMRSLWEVKPFLRKAAFCLSSMGCKGLLGGDDIVALSTAIVSGLFTFEDSLLLWSLFVSNGWLGLG